RNTYVGTQNAPPPYELGTAPIMRQRIEAEYYFKDGTQTGFLPSDQSILFNPDDLTGNKYRLVTEPTGVSFSYVRDIRVGGPLADPNYGQATTTPITRTDVEQQARLQFLKSIPLIIATLDTAGGAVEALGGEGLTTLYRSVSHAEYADIVASGVLRPGPNSY